MPSVDVMTCKVFRRIGFGRQPRQGARMSYETVDLRIENGVAEITLNRPERLNAWTTQFGDELREALLTDAADPAVRAVLITGAGRGFSSGADLKEMLEQRSSGGEVPDVGEMLRERYHPIIKGIRQLPKPVVAAVNGPAVGIGCSLALACDPIPAQQALDWGLINRVVPDGDLMDDARALAGRLAQGPTRSYAQSKRALNNSFLKIMDEQLDLEADIQGEMVTSADFIEGVSAFIEKRDPGFTGN